MMLTRPALATAATLALLAGLSGCGGGGGGGNGFADESPADIVKAADADMSSLDNVHYTGQVTGEGQLITLDVTASSTGDCQGTFSMGEDGASAEILSVGGTTWFKPNEAFWRDNAASKADEIIAAVGDKYVILPASDDSFHDVCDISSIVKSDDDGESTYAETGTTKIDGQDVVEITKSGGEDSGSVGYILTGSKHYFVKLENKTSDSPGTVTFDNYDGDFTPKAPDVADTIDLTKLG